MTLDFSRVSSEKSKTHCSYMYIQPSNMGLSSTPGNTRQ